jgi:hypothetical protein
MPNLEFLGRCLITTLQEEERSTIEEMEGSFRVTQRTEYIRRVIKSSEYFDQELLTSQVGPFSMELVLLYG